jgi:predicted enzyme related to lactoylglutathione lyase
VSRHHRIDYLEFTVHDVAVAKAFYGSVFGWSFTDYAPTYAGIAGAEEGDPEVGGLTQGEVVRGGVLVVLYSDDLQATQQAVVAAGGTICKPTFSFPGGRRFHFLDPSGNELAVWAQP